MRTIVILIVLAGLSVGAYYGYEYYSQAEQAPRYKTIPVKRSKVVYTVTATGTVEPVIKVVVGSQVSGTITKWYADFNQSIKKDEVLAELDQDRFKATSQQRAAALATAKARAEEAQAHLAQAKLERKRLEEMKLREMTSEIEFQTAVNNEQAAAATLHGAEADILSAEANLRLANVDLDKTVIRSPIDGVVISRDIDAGQTVAASLSSPTLFTIANDLTKMQVNAAVSETDIGRVKQAMNAEFRVDAYPERRFKGVVSQVRYNQTVVDNVVTYTTLIDVDNKDLLLRPGMTATILFEVAKADDVLVVPNAALRFNPKVNPAEIDFNRPGRGQARQPRVYTLATDGDLKEVKLELGLTDGSVTQVKGGELKEGDVVVTERDFVGGANRRSPGGGGTTPQRMPRMM